ncbi:MAG: bifunctional diaminohydroxyphosphoribosylaminopyrimidine deaminase/5-amino-6-(5-phosphoribosylamino)uracil reductase RibD [Rikenellaceae bacterium]
MTTDEKYMSYALQLAQRGGINVLTNPNVGSVVVYNGRIIGEGYHRQYGKAHAEVNAIDSVKDEDRQYLSESTIYVNLEPCCHTGKTPPCTQKIIDNGLKRVVIGMQDPFPQVNGEGIAILRQAGIDVTVGVLEQESIDLNKNFIVYNAHKRPYIIFKWAQTLDGFIDSDRTADMQAAWLTGERCKQLVHKWRSEINGIMVGSSTIEKDNPRLNTREWSGASPVKITIDREGKLKEEGAFFMPDSKKIIFTEVDKVSDKEDVEYIKVDFSSEGAIKEVMEHLYRLKIKVLMVEGGTKLVKLLVENGLFDEARVFSSPIMLSELKGGENLKGVKAPMVPEPQNTKVELIDNITLKTCYYRNY